MAFKDLYEHAKKQGAGTAALKQIDEDARKATGLGVTDRVVPSVSVNVPAVQPTTTSEPSVKLPDNSGSETTETGTEQKKPEDQGKSPAQLAKEQATKAYEDYLQSDEHKQRLKEAEAKAKLDAAARALNPNFDIMTPQLIQDEKEAQLKAAKDQADADYNRYLDEQVMAADLEELETWTAEDRAALVEYIASREQEFYNNLNPFADSSFGEKALMGASGIIEKYGKQRVDEIAESYTRSQNKKTTEDITAMAQEEADKGVLAGIGHSAATIPANLVGGPLGTMGYLRELSQRSGRYTTLDPNNAGNLFNAYSGAVRGTVAQNIEGENGENGVAGKVGSVLYQGGMSALDSGARALTGSAGNMILSGMSSFSQTVADASQKGATPGQAVALATVNAGIEAASEAIPLDNLIKTARGDGLGTVLKNALRQAGIEATTEEISLIGTVLAEAAILQEKAAYKQEVRAYILDGMSPEEARAKANNTILQEALNTALVAGVSGSMSSFGASYADAKNLPTPPTVKEAADMMLGDLVKPKQEQNAASVETAPETSGGTVTNSMAEQILRDPEALDIILQETATQLVGSRAAQRAQIKNAVYQLAGVQPESDATPVQRPEAQQTPVQQTPAQQIPQQQTQAPTKTRQQKNAVYAELQHAVAAQKDLQKKIEKAEAKVESGKGSAAYLAQLKVQMEQQTKNVDQLRSQNDYFGGDYDTTVEKAAQTQQAVFDQARQEAIDAENAFNKGRISKAQYDAAQQLFMEAVQGAGENYKKTQTTINNREKQTQEEKKAQPLKEPEKKTRNEPQRIKEPVMARDTTHAVKKVYFQEATISPNTAFFSPDVKPKESNIPFTLYSDNTVGLDIDNSKYKEGFATIESVYNTFSGYYEFAIDGEKVSEGDILKDGKYYTFDDIKRPVVREINGGNYVLAKKGVLNFYSDFREVKTRAVKIQETSSEDQVKQATQQPEAVQPQAQAAQQQTSMEAPTAAQQVSAPQTDMQMGANNQSAVNGQIKGTGAAEADFSGKPAYNATLSAENAQPDRRTDVRPMELMADNGGKLSNKAAENILHDPEAVSRIMQQTGEDISGTKSEQRAKLKTAMEQLFNVQNSDTAGTETANAEQQAAPQAPAEPQMEQPQAQMPQRETAAEPQTVAQQDNAPQADTDTGVQMGASNVQGQSPEGVQQDYRNSNTYMNTGVRSTNENIRAGYRQELKADPEAAKYAVKHNADTLAEAQNRVSTPESANAALDDLLTKDIWTAEDVATSTLLLDQIMASGDRDAIAKLNDLRRRRKEVGVQAGQVAQSFSIQNAAMGDAESPATAVDTFRSNLNSMKESETTYSPKSGVDFETWKQNIQDEVDKIGIAIATVEDGDADGMRDIIRQIARARKTTAWFGRSENVTAAATRVLNKLGFEDLKKIANTQVASMAEDYRRRGAGEVAGAIRKQNMLSSLKTFVRNISGNGVGGFADAVSESGAGQMADFVLSKFTGKRTVGNDLARGKEYVSAAKEAGQFASLCVELNIPIETDVDASFDAAAGKGSNEKYVGRAFRATGNPAMRALYAYQKYMSYALEVTDKIFEGGSNAAVTESLNRLKNANLTEEDTDSLAQFTANKRTYKNAAWETTEMVDGKEQKVKHGAEAARFVSSAKNLGGNTKAGRVWQAYADYKVPFANVPMNVMQTGIDYSTGVVKGLGEMIGIIKDVKAGKTIPVERQRQAASDFGRGVTGTVMIGMFASAAAMGALKASDDEDWNKEALAQAEGRSGAQMNWSALLRGLRGESAKWRDGDVISGMDFLEPFNTQMYLGYEIANTEDMNLLKYAGATVKSVWESLMDSPVMTGLAEIEDTLKDLSEAETPEDVGNVFAGNAGDAAASFIPQFVRQAAQETDGYYRDTRGATAAESAMNSIKAAIPGLSKTLPKKYSGLGEVQERGSAFETFVDPTATKRYNENEVTTFLDELHEKTGDDSIYPERQAPMKIKVDGEDISLDGTMRETYQKTYGENVEAFYSELKDRVDFQNMTQEQQVKALNDAEAYAAELAKAAVLEGYDGMDGWMASVKGNPTDEIINKAVTSSLTGAFKDGGNPEAMEAAYNAYKSLSPDQRQQIRSEATGKTKHYFTAKEAGISEEKYLELYGNYEQIRDNENLDNGQKAVEWAHYLNKAAQRGEITAEQKKAMGGAIHFYHNIQATTGKYETMVGEGIDPDTAYMISKTLDGITGTGSNGTVRDIDTREAIANSGLPEAEIDAVMKAYMSDYDPNAKTKQYTELKYDYIRHGLGLTPAEYAETYKAYLDGPSKADDIKAIMDLGFSKEVATTLYNVYQSTKKGKAAYMGFYEKQQ